MVRCRLRQELRGLAGPFRLRRSGPGDLTHRVLVAPLPARPSERLFLRSSRDGPLRRRRVAGPYPARRGRSQGNQVPLRPARLPVRRPRESLRHRLHGARGLKRVGFLRRPSQRTRPRLASHVRPFRLLRRPLLREVRASLPSEPTKGRRARFLWPPFRGPRRSSRLRPQARPRPAHPRENQAHEAPQLHQSPELLSPKSHRLAHSRGPRQDTSRQDTSRQDTFRQDTFRQDTFRQDTSRQDTSRQDTSRQDTFRRALERLRIADPRRRPAGSRPKAPERPQLPSAHPWCLQGQRERLARLGGCRKHPAAPPHRWRLAGPVLHRCGQLRRPPAHEPLRPVSREDLAPPSNHGPPGPWVRLLPAVTDERPLARRRRFLRERLAACPKAAHRAESLRLRG